MPATRYGVSPWLDKFPASKRPAFPAFKSRDPVEVPLVVIGGGLAGVMTAYACAAAGVRVVLLEADRLGSGGSGLGTGIASAEGSTSFVELQALAGRRVARAHFEHAHRAVLDLAAAARRLGIKAEMDARDAWRVAPVGYPTKALQKDVDERRGADLDATWHKPAAVARSVAVEVAGGARLPGWAQCDPYRLLLGFARAAVARGAQIYERSAVTRVTFDRKVATVVTGTGRITAARVAHCTGEPTALVKALVRHFRLEERAVVLSAELPRVVRKAVGPRASIVTDIERPAHLIRWTGDHRVMVAGADGPRLPVRLREKAHVQRTGQLMYELTRLYPDISGVLPAYGWSIPLAHSHDGGLYAGPHRNFPHQLFALGTLHDPARAYLASRILLRHVTGETTSDDEHFGFARSL
ncbi:MAG: NAD(P)/FAD-dependent oxidoreductase [Vicinamibacterales bacterium]